MSIPQHIQDNFSRHARHYDDYCALQNEAAAMLLSQYRPQRPPKRILELGCGTGNFTRLLCDRFGEATVMAQDPSAAMLQQARFKAISSNVRFSVGLVHDLGTDVKYDLIAANAVLHWQADLYAALGHLAGALAQDGTVLTSWFGPRTYEELGQVLSESLNRPVQLTAAGFPEGGAIRAALSDHFLRVSIQEQRFTRCYVDLTDLLRTIKYTGTRGHGVPGLHLSRRDLRELDIQYRHAYGDIRVTYQIYYAQAGRN